jgi:putative MATE family efflux protein
MASNNSPNELETQKIGTLLWQYSIPAIVATAAASLYNIIDRIFIGQGVGPLAISGLALTFPLMNLAAAFGALVGAGASTLVSIRLGEKRRQQAILVLGNTLLLNIILSTSFSIIVLFFLDKVLYILGASKDTLPYAREFMQVILAGNVFTHIYLGLNNIMRSSGYPRKAMITTLVAVGANLILAPLFIFVFKWGIRGAAAATVCAQFIGTMIVLFHFMKRHSYVRFLPGYFKLKFQIIKDIFSIGMSNFLMLTTSSLIIIILNLSLAKYGGDYAIGAFGIINSLSNLFVMIVIGFNQGMQPIAGYNYGARKYQRVAQVYKRTIINASMVAAVAFILAEGFPRYIAAAFTTNNELINLAVIGMRITMLSFLVDGFQIVTASFFQSIGKAKISILISLLRQVLLLIPALLILPRFLGLNGVWGAIPVADFTAATVTFIVIKSQFHKIIKP